MDETRPVGSLPVERSESPAHHRFLEGMERIDDAIRRAIDRERLTEDVLETLLEIFHADRVWLAPPPDEEDSLWSLPVAASAPGWSPLEKEVSLDATRETLAELLAAARATRGPVVFGPDHEPAVSRFLGEALAVRSQMTVALRPREGEPWLLVLHQCTHVRDWSEEDRILATAIAHRLTDALDTLMVVRDRRRSEERFRLLANGLPGAIYSNIHRPTATGWEYEETYMSAGLKDLIGERNGGAVLDGSREFRDLIHPDDLPRLDERTNGPAVTHPPDIEYRVRTDSGEYIWIRSIARTKSLDGGKSLWSGILLDITQRNRVQEQLRFTWLTVDHASQAIYWVGHDGRVIYANESARSLTGHDREEVTSLTLHDICPEITLAMWPLLWETLRNRRSLARETTASDRHGRTFPVEVTINLFEFEGTEYSVASVRDISEKKRAEAERDKLEAQLRQAQKMEAVGQLAGGMAHDFNNILTTVFGHAEFARSALEKDSPTASIVRGELEEIECNARRAAGLIRQLLVFSRRDVSPIEVLDLGEVLSEMQEMLRRLITEEIDFEIQVAEGNRRVRASRGQIEQVIMNLVLNAHDAMREGGKLSITITPETLDDAAAAAHPDAEAGPYVAMTVRDNGCGMPPEVAERVFEPFFTTKPVGRGTGLGLSMVYGTVRRAGGHLTLDSAPGHGSTFRIHLPAARAGAVTLESTDAAPPPLCGTETLLVCEDDDAVRELTTRMLVEGGYDVLEAENGDRAIAIAERHPGRIHLLVTDVVMPGMNGKRLARALRARDPELRTLFVSGYASQVLAERDLLDESVEFLEKPFGFQGLLQRVRDVLDANRPLDANR